MMSSLLRRSARRRPSKRSSASAKHTHRNLTIESLEDRTLLSASPWLEGVKLTASDAAAVDFFGASVGISGDTAVVGAPLEDGAAGNAGAAHGLNRSS